MDALLRALVDEGRKRILLFALSRAAGRQGAAGGAFRAGALLPPRRHAAVRRSPDLRTPGSSHLVHQWLRHRRRTIAVHPDGAGIGEQEPTVRDGSRRAAEAKSRRAEHAGRRDRRRRVCADWKSRLDDFSTHRSRRAEPPDYRDRTRPSRAVSLEDHRRRAATGD